MVEILCNRPITLCLAYKSPNATDVQISELTSVIEDLANVDNLIILGDFNCPDIDWQSLTAGSQFSTRFCDLLYNHNLAQLVISPTHVKGNTLDLVITNSEDIFNNIWVDPDHNIYSDHYQVHFSIAASKPSKPTNSRYALVYDYTKADFDRMCSSLMDHNFADFLQSEDIDDLWFYLKSVIREAVDKYVPQVRISNSNSPKWFTPDIRHCINRLRHRRRKNRKKPSNVVQFSIANDERVLQEKINVAIPLWLIGS